MKMNTTLLLAFLVILSNATMAQKSNVTDAAMLMKKYSPMLGAEKATKTANDAKGFIDLAAAHPDTKEGMKMHLYRGMVYFALIEVAQFDAMAGKMPDESLLERYKTVSMESFGKVINDPKGKYSDDAKGFIGQRVTQYFEMGLSMYEKKNFEMAFMSFLGAYQVKTFIGEEYEDAKANAMATYAYVTDSLIRVEQLDKAEKMCDAANEISPNDMGILTNYINIALKRGDTEKSEQYINEALAIDPNNKQLYYILGTSYIELKQNEKAESNLLKAIEIDPEYVNAHSNLAALYMDWSISLGDEAKDLDYRDPRVTELENKKKEILAKAIPSLEKMIVAFPENKSVMKNLAMAYRSSGNEEKFKEWYDKSKN
ncbi:MAG: tetratricopeptide repeat protein [Crocinitomicaceae bacterium]|tara:strand:- start:2064 stop:3176 length:1113 start_codon:yes stop_codon:yes gene_type:complete